MKKIYVTPLVRVVILPEADIMTCSCGFPNCSCESDSSADGGPRIMRKRSTVWDEDDVW